NWKKIPGKLQTSLSLQGKLIWIFVLSALISFGFPFAIKGLGWLLDYTGPFQQFRAIARVGWVSFYAINFVSIPYLFHRAKKLNPSIRYVFLSFIPLILFWEGYEIKPQMQNPPHLEKAYQSEYDFSEIDVNEYQALLPDPYLHAGSECLSWEPAGFNQDQFFEVCYQLGLPGFAGIMSRTSLFQAVLHNQLVCPPYEMPQIIHDLKEIDTRPILVLESKLDLYNRNSGLSHWTRGTEIVYEHPEFRLRKLPLEHFDVMVNQFKDSLGQNPSDTIFKHELIFDHVFKDKDWGYEAVMYCDSQIHENVTFSFDVKINENRDVNAVIEVRQIAKDQRKTEQFSTKSNYHYKKLGLENMYVELPIYIKPETDTIVIRLRKDNQKEKDKIDFHNAIIFKTKSR